jgi:hypothetical protein
MHKIATLPSKNEPDTVIEWLNKNRWITTQWEQLKQLVDDCSTSAFLFVCAHSEVLRSDDFILVSCALQLGRQVSRMGAVTFPHLAPTADIFDEEHDHLHAPLHGFGLSELLGLALFNTLNDGPRDDGVHVLCALHERLHVLQRRNPVASSS